MTEPYSRSLLTFHHFVIVAEPVKLVANIRMHHFKQLLRHASIQRYKPMNVESRTLFYSAHYDIDCPRCLSVFRCSPRGVQLRHTVKQQLTDDFEDEDNKDHCRETAPHKKKINELEINFGPPKMLTTPQPTQQRQKGIERETHQR